MISKIIENVENRRRFTCRDQSHPGQALISVAEKGLAAKAGPHYYKSLVVDGDASAKPVGQ